MIRFLPINNGDKTETIAPVNVSPEQHGLKGWGKNRSTSRSTALSQLKHSLHNYKILTNTFLKYCTVDMDMDMDMDIVDIHIGGGRRVGGTLRSYFEVAPLAMCQL